MSAPEPVDLAAARALAGAATPGPWDYLWFGTTKGAGYAAGYGQTGFPPLGLWRTGPTMRPTDSHTVRTTTSGAFTDEDAAFIAHARTLVPALCDEVERLRQGHDFARLLGPARMVLDRCAEGVAKPGEAADMAQRIVDLIGHRVTDEPPHALVELEWLRDEVEDLRRRLAESVPRSALVQVRPWDRTTHALGCWMRTGGPCDCPVRDEPVYALREDGAR